MWLSTVRSETMRSSWYIASINCSREKMRPGRVLSTLSNWYSTAVRPRSWPSRVARQAASSSFRPWGHSPVAATACVPRRSTARTRATTSRGLKGLQM